MTTTTKATQKLLLSPREAAHLLGLSERKLWAETSPRGTIPAIKIGRNVRYSLTSLECWIVQQLGGSD